MAATCLIPLLNPGCLEDHMLPRSAVPNEEVRWGDMHA